ncbi:probable leucine-rich repeat receptor-like protein kinase At5g63930 [Cryptomeria japonica]|uniref:probable leucine-rich repeat receptor-like protein kinase At5g63930 n=1 Tax=Cryptomeria japonica TaxID=3369 RepID=UPI0027DA7016|nr:probable leucine-rich repeat receptor-like protein kinase At5g63930 [Cryptomeria japonica]
MITNRDPVTKKNQGPTVGPAVLRWLTGGRSGGVQLDDYPSRSSDKEEPGFGGGSRWIPSEPRASLITSAYGLSEGDILLKIKESLQGDGGRDFLSDWSNNSASSDFSGWRSWTVDLSGNRLYRHVPPELGNCTRLQHLNLSSNFFSGVIPSTLINCSLLTFLDLSSNNICGFILPELAELSNLSELHLYSNSLSGPVPASLGKLGNLQFLKVGNNRFSSSLPPEITNCSKLKYVSFASSNLKGTIPREIGKLQWLEELYLFDIQLNGFIPPTVGNCRALLVFSVFENNIEGPIPTEFGLLRRLQTLWLYKNLLSGLLPAELGNMSMLQDIDVSSNNLVGSLPEEVGRLKNLSFLSLHSNSISGRVPALLGNLTNLQLLNFQKNQLSGTLPEAMGTLPNLVKISISSNRLEGQLPASRGSFSDLEILDAYSNRLSGEFPPGICRAKQLRVLTLFDNLLVGNISLLLKDCISLERVRLQNNHFTGHIPSDISKLSGLDYLELSFDRLDGEIPGEIGQLKNLTNLILCGNYLSGPIPPEIGDLRNLGRLNLSINNLIGNIPSQVGSLMRLEGLDLSRNSLESAIPQHLGANFSELLTLKLSFNNLSGSIPASLGDCSSLIELDLSRNRREKSIPREIGKLVHLSTGLDLSRNRLSGSLPPEIGNLPLLESLDISHNQLSGFLTPAIGNLLLLALIDVSHNQLSGQIPQALSRLVLLSKVNFSFNRFTGQIPALKSFSKGAFDGNDGLCGPPTSNPCLESRNSSSNDKSLVRGGVAGIVIAGLATITLVIIALVYYRREPIAQDEESNKEEDTSDESLSIVEVDIAAGYKHRITYQEILNATEEFSDKYLIGSGSFSRVYKVLLTEAENGFVIAAKVLRLQEEGRSSFMREIDALKFVRHRNIVRFLGFVSGDSINMDILLFQYMAKGSLREALKSQKLGLEFRWNIALGEAQALKYLHHDCTPPIVHRDLKSANILLDDEHVAHVADFGLAKFLYSEGQSSCSSLYVGTHGYMAPECGYGVRHSTKQDVFSFGVVLLELVTAKAAIVDEEGGGGETRGLAEWAAIMRKKDGHVVLDLIDAELANDYEKCWNLVDTPSTYEEAKGKDEWEATMQDEYNSLMKNGTWELTTLSERKNVVSGKWTYRTKFTIDGVIEKHKARLVARRFSQEGIDYTETFAAVAKKTSIHTTVALAAKFRWEIFQMDVTSAFLNGDLKKEIYMQQPPGFVKVGKGHLVCRLKKSLYDLKQATRVLYSKINEYFRKA